MDKLQSVTECHILMYASRMNCGHLISIIVELYLYFIFLTSSSIHLHPSFTFTMEQQQKECKRKQS